MSTLGLYVTTVTVLDLRHGKYHVEYLLVTIIRWIIVLLSVVRIKESSNNYLLSLRIFVMDKYIRYHIFLVI